jgi:formate hydrogenlyase subunit 3/multisubunit Na+/H+ antiporter MnhD subunit
VTWTVLLFALINCAVKGGLISWLLRRAPRVSGTRSELDPFVSYTIAVLLGVAALGAASWLSTRLPFVGRHLAQYVALLRMQQICVAAGLEQYTGQVLRWFGLFSMGIAALMIIAQTDFKRMLAYSSVEPMGILALGVGIGGAGIFGALLHALNHSLAKALLFFVAGNIIAL